MLVYGLAKIDLCPQLIPKTGKAPSQATNLAEGRETTELMVYANIPETGGGWVCWPQM